MQKWEYYLLQNVATPNRVGVYGYQPDGTRIKLSEETGTAQISNQLNKLGEEGWEVVGNSAEGYFNTWTLKRIKE